MKTPLQVLPFRFIKKRFQFLNKFKNPVGLGIIMLLALAACKSDTLEHSERDPTKQTIISGFMPDSGGIASQFVVTGSNFGTDINDVKVYFNNKPAKILNMKGGAIYCLVPKQPGESSVISVVIGQDSIAYTEKEFKYNIKASVSTVTGKAKESGGKDGSLAEATFYLPRYVGVDNEDNIFVVDDEIRRVRLVSQSNNKVMTLTNKVAIGQPVFNADKSIVYFLGDGDQTIYAFDAATQWIMEKIGKVSNDGYFHSLAFNQNENYAYTRKNSGAFLRIDMNRTIPNNTVVLGNISQVSGGQNGHMVYNPVDGHFYCANNRDNLIYKIKLSDDGLSADIKPYAGNGVGWTDGPVSQAKFNFPRGIAVDSEGNILVADQNNHCIRQISLDGIVTTLAGQPGIAGYEDGEPEKSLFDQPTGLAVDKNDIIYISDQNNHSVRKLAIE